MWSGGREALGRSAGDGGEPEAQGTKAPLCQGMGFPGSEEWGGGKAGAKILVWTIPGTRAPIFEKVLQSPLATESQAFKPSTLKVLLII